MMGSAAARPSSMRHLDNSLKRLAGDDGSYVDIRSLIANSIVGQLLPNGVVKGGTSLKLRFGGQTTRYTTDLDTARSQDLDNFIEHLARSLREGWCGFTGRLIAKKQAHPENVPAQYVMQPFDIKLSYLGKSWCTVSLEVGHNEIGDADEPEFIAPIEANAYLKQLGFPELKPIPLMPLHFQVAQKLHGASEPGSARAHDLIDLQLILRNASLDLSKTKTTCERLFAYRDQQPWPPEITVGDNWPSLYSAQRFDLMVCEDVEAAVAWTNNLIEEIQKAP